MTTEATDRALREALGRLLAGTPTRTDGRITVRAVCAEADLSTDSFYRSAIREELAAAMANAESQQPEVVLLRRELAAAQREIKELKRKHHGELRELQHTIDAYANQIQILALENHHLREQAGTGSVTPLLRPRSVSEAAG